MTSGADDQQVWTNEFGRRCSKYIEGKYEGPHWCKGTTKHGTIYAVDVPAAQALFKELTGEDAVDCGQLPYGATPNLNMIVYPGGSTSAQGSFCFDPHKCIGHSSCPQRRACSE